MASPNLLRYLQSRDHAPTILIEKGPALLALFTYFNLIVNVILLSLLVATFLFSKTAKRHPTLVNLCVTWLFSGVCGCLLFFAGQAKGPEPSKPLCVAQSAFIYGITPMWSVAILMLLYYVLLCVRGKQAALGFRQLVFMLASPYIVQVSFTLAALFISWNHPDLVTRAQRFFYCSIDHPTLELGMLIFTLIICLLILFVEVLLALTTYRNWRALRHAGLKARGGISLEILARVLVFGVYVFFGMVVVLVAMFSPQSVVPDMYAATAGTAVFLVFGTQIDVLRIWFPFFPFPRPPPRPIIITPASVLCPDGVLTSNPYGINAPCMDAQFDLLGGPSPEKVAEAHKNLPPPAPPPKPRGYINGMGMPPRYNSWTGMRSPFGPGMGLDMGRPMMGGLEKVGRLEPVRPGARR